MTETVWLAIISTFGGLLTVAITFIGTLMVKRMDAAAAAMEKSEEERKARNEGIDEKLTQIHTLTNSTASDMKAQIELLTEKLIAAKALTQEMQVPTTGPVAPAAPAAPVAPLKVIVENVDPVPVVQVEK